ncbi:MAG: hypothetical protein IT385_28295 [Deltaproteobacteria bacterium]|nr:hypothetical protein [Deltaproteobacteria bacterium]
MRRLSLAVPALFVLASGPALAFDPDSEVADPAVFSDLVVQDYQALVPGNWVDYTADAPLVVDDLAYWGNVWPTNGWCIPGMDSSPPCGGTNVYLASAMDLHITPLVPIDRIGFDYGTQSNWVTFDVVLSDGSTRTFDRVNTTPGPWGSYMPAVGFFGYGTGDPALTIVEVYVTGADGGIDDMRYGVAATVNACDDLEAMVRDLGLGGGIERSLLAKIEAADRQIERGAGHVAANLLGALIAEIEAQRGKAIAADDADDLVACVEARIDSLE